MPLVSRLMYRTSLPARPRLTEKDMREDKPPLFSHLQISLLSPTLRTLHSSPYDPLLRISSS